MNLLEKLDFLKQKNGETNATLSRNAGIPYTTIDGIYKKGYQNMKLSTLLAIADYFGVSIDYLARDDEEEFAGSISKEEQRLLLIYRELNEDGKRSLVEQAEMHAMNEHYVRKGNGDVHSGNAAI